MSEEEPKEYVYQPRGAVWDLYWENRDPEVLLEGPAGTGKSRGALEYAYMCATNYPGCRILFLRNVKSTLAESILPEWESSVLWPGHPVLAGSEQMMENRRSYTFPHAKVIGDGTFHPDDKGKVYEGETHIVLGGLDKNQVDKTYSSQYDLIIVFEAFEITEDAWQKLFRANRNWHMPWQQMVADTNPNIANHWLHLRADKPYEVPPELKDQLDVRPGQTMMTRLVSKHKDNPKFWDHKEKKWTHAGANYIAKLHRLSGARKDNLLHGKWTSVEGLIFEDWNRGTHVIHAELKTEHGVHKLYVEDWDDPIILTWFIASVDWGYHPNPGTVQVWGMDQEDRRFLVAEIYQTKRQLDWWADKIADLHARFDFKAVVCDGSEPHNIDALNMRLGTFRGREVPSLAQKQSRKHSSRTSGWQAGIDQIRFGLKSPEDGVPRLFVLSDALKEGADPELRESGRPTSFAQEMDLYRYMPNEDGKPRKEQEDPRCDAHGIDAARYAWTWGWRKDLSPKEQNQAYAPGTFGAVLGHGKKRRGGR